MNYNIYYNLNLKSVNYIIQKKISKINAIRVLI